HHLLAVYRRRHGFTMGSVLDEEVSGDRLPRHPGDSLQRDRFDEQVAAGTDRDGCGGGVYRRDESRLAHGHSETAALTDRESDDSLVTSHDFPGLVDDEAGDEPFGGFAGQEPAIVATPDEADVHRLRLVGRPQPQLRRLLAGAGLRQLPHREPDPS